MASALPSLLLFLTLSVLTTTISAHNITAILSAFPEYSQYNTLLSQTKLADEINSRQTITVLVLNNGALSTLTAKHPLSVIKNALSLLVLLDYFDPTKLHQIPKGTTLSTTLYQTTGNAPGNLGFVNITDTQGGKVGFGSAAPGSKLDSSYTKSVKQIPFNVSVLEISAPIIAPSILTAPAPSASDVNITGLLEKAGAKTFVSLIVSSGVLKTYQSALDKGLTIFAPSDEAFKAPGLPDLNKLTNAEVVSLLEYHASPAYIPVGSLKTSKDPISTLATSGVGKYDISTTTAGDSVTLHSGLTSSRVAETVLDATPVAIFTVDSVLLPTELFGKAPSPAPAGEPVASPSPTPVLAPSPNKAPVEAPSPSAASPPAPAGEAPGGAPADAPSDDSRNSTADKDNAVHVKASVMLTVLVMVSATLMSSIILS
ncbi:Fasciclin-like arabinogalactan protein [Quillaja saponaria]|uniref:Fasciclin-like arabinogalactan protein n=1 Tax=Quillaja saponaria TaxID=32244 RepID=A0AAD7L480_QUISA|nr:Fasciclin-like arabinogalactan protein [Quillaja saponaria]